jgi:UDP-glucose 4-epimerase
MKINALVLGGNGFIGSHLVDRLLLEGHTVRVFDKYEEHYRKPIPDVDYRFGDFGNRGLLAESLEGVDVVFHLVSTTLPKTSNDDPAFDVQSNVVESIYLLEKCILTGVKKVVFVSSGGTVYGKPLTLPVQEDDPTNPLCSYGISKLTIEKYLALFHQLYNLDYVVVRPSNPYGNRQNPSGIQGAITVFLGKAARNEKIEIWGDGEIVRDYIFISDLVEGIIRASQYHTASRVFNLGSGSGQSLNKILSIIRNVTGNELRVNYTKMRSFDVPKIFLDIRRAQKELSWEPHTSLETGIKKTWDFVQSITPRR